MFKFKENDRVLLIKGDSKSEFPVLIESVLHKKSRVILNCSKYRTSNKLRSSQNRRRAFSWANLRHVDHNGLKTKIFKTNGIRYYKSNNRIVRGDVFNIISRKRRLNSKTKLINES